MPLFIVREHEIVTFHSLSHLTPRNLMALTFHLLVIIPFSLQAKSQGTCIFKNGN